MTLEIKSERRNLTFGSGEPAISHEKAVEIVKEYARLMEIAEMAEFIHVDSSFPGFEEDAQQLAEELYKAGYKRQVKGEWILQQNGNGICSNCKRQDAIDNLARFCRYCGAKMKVGSESV